MDVGLWVAGEPFALVGATPAGEIEPAPGDSLTISVLGIDDNQAASDPIGVFAPAVAAAAC